MWPHLYLATLSDEILPQLYNDVVIFSNFPTFKPLKYKVP